MVIAGFYFSLYTCIFHCFGILNIIEFLSLCSGLICRSETQGVHLNGGECINIRS